MMGKGDKMPHVVIAATKEEARFQAVEVRKHDNTFEVLWTRSLPAAEGTWTGFAAACGVATGRDGHDRLSRRHAAAVVGLDSTGVAFYRVTAPAVESQEMASIVRMQAESLLPLPPDQIEVAWRATPATNGNVDITIAAARREYLHKFAGSVHDFRPGRIWLSCEGMAHAWQRLFSERQPRAVLLSFGAQHTQLCLVQDGLVMQAAVLGAGMADLREDDLVPESGTATPSPASAANPVAALAGMIPDEGRGESHHPPSIERFAQDVRTVLGSFGWDESASWAILVLSDGSESMNRIVASLNAAGLPVKVSVPEARNLRLPAGFKPEDLYEYRTALGLSLLALERPSGTLDLFERIVAEQEKEKVTSAWRNVFFAAGAALVALVALLATAYLTDVAAARRWTDLAARPDFEAARQHQALVKTVARHRPDLLELLATVNSGKNDGIVLDSFHFKKGQAVTMAGQAGNTEQMWAFEKNLKAQKDLANVALMNPTQDTKTKKVKFTITFSYKSFSRKDAAL
jgi:hypothetical protein